MKATTWLSGLAPLTLAAVLGSGGCGSDVATCASVCQLPGAPTDGSCTSNCDGTQTATATVGASGDFQAYLTCLENAGTYSAIDGVCAPIAQTVAAEAASAIGGSGGSCGSATCATVCAMGGGDTASCTETCTAAQTECSAAQAQFQTLLGCLCKAGGWFTGTTSNTACAEDLIQLDEDCAAFNNSVGDAG
jgi:hypothetical protein